MRPKTFIYYLFGLVFFSSNLGKASQIDTLLIRKDLIRITQTPKSRQYQNSSSLNLVADYLKAEFLRNSTLVTEQSYLVHGQEYRNIICSFGPLTKPRLVIGAHYDVCGDQPGADDNASGVAGLLELSRLLSKQSLNFRIDLVAYTLEEPPFFRTEHMGSYVHAQSLKNQNVPVIDMISLEMIGYFSGQRQNQQYPLSFSKLFYSSTGDYITVVQKFGAGRFARKFNRQMHQQALLPVKTCKAPAKVHVMDFSDHQNYWQMGYSAIMITDTSFYRNPHYYLPSDTLGTLNLKKMSKVLETVYQAIIHYPSG